MAFYVKYKGFDGKVNEPEQALQVGDSVGFSGRIAKIKNDWANVFIGEYTYCIRLDQLKRVD